MINLCVVTCQTARLISSATVEIRRAGITDKEIEEDRKIKEYWESRISFKCAVIAESAQFLRYNVLGK